MRIGASISRHRVVLGVVPGLPLEMPLFATGVLVS